MTLGQKLRKLRNDKGITQKDLADQLHVTFQTISKWESDKNEPDLATLKEIANYFNVTLAPTSSSCFLKIWLSSQNLRVSLSRSTKFILVSTLLYMLSSSLT